MYSNIAKQPGWLGGARVRFSDGTRVNNETSISENVADYTASATVASDWYWACGPEAGTVFYNTVKYNSVSGTVDGVFNFFSNTTTYNRYPNQQSIINATNQPDSAGSIEAFLQFAYNGYSSWNDLDTTAYYAPVNGYYVEYTGTVSGTNASGSARIPLSALITTIVNTSEGGTVSPGGLWAFGSSHPLTAAPNEGWRFIGWTIVSGDGTLSTTTDPSTTFTVAGGPATIRADFEKEAYTISFESNGGTAVPADQVRYYGETVTEPTAPTKAGYTFAGWYTDDKTFANPWDFDSDTVTSNVTLYAKWNEVPETNPPGIIKPPANGSETVYPAAPQTGGDNSIFMWVLLLTSVLILIKCKLTSKITKMKIQ